MRDYKALNVWNEAMELVVHCYKATANFPRREQYGITGQMRRSAISIPSNIAEGCGRDTDGDLRRFLNIAYSSGCELGAQIDMAQCLGFGTASELDDLNKRTDAVRSMLWRFIDQLKTA